MKASRKRTRAIGAKKVDPTALKVTQQPAESSADALARTSLRPTVQAALTLMDYNKDFGELSINTLVNGLVDQCKLANDGDLGRAEAILIAQAHALDAIFHHFARRALRVEYLSQFDTQMRFALKAQAQCRATLEALASFKNPSPVAFIRQANIAHGPQQVNNGCLSPNGPCSRAAETTNPQNRHFDQQDGERKVAGAVRAAGCGEAAMATTAAFHAVEEHSR